MSDKSELKIKLIATAKELKNKNSFAFLIRPPELKDVARKVS